MCGEEMNFTESYWKPRIDKQSNKFEVNETINTKGEKMRVSTIKKFQFVLLFSLTVGMAILSRLGGPWELSVFATAFAVVCGILTMKTYWQEVREE